jgi:hypothetical protein
MGKIIAVIEDTGERRLPVDKEYWTHDFQVRRALEKGEYPVKISLLRPCGRIAEWLGSANYGKTSEETSSTIFSKPPFRPSGVQV